MALDQEILKIAKWAVNAAENRIELNDPALTPSIDRAVGWDDRFSRDQQPRRKVFNQIFRELTGAAVDGRDIGILPWSELIDYVGGESITQVAGVLYRATEDTGPATSNATDPTTGGQTIWAAVSGTTNAPDAPNAPQAAAANGQLTWVWNCPKDNGAIVSRFEFQQRTAGQSWPETWQSEVHARRVERNLSNGQTYEARVRAVNAIGTSRESVVGNGTPQAEVPGRVAGVIATGGENGEVPLRWEAPDDGGAPITSYIVQWRTSTQQFQSTRQRSVSGTSDTVPNLANDTEHFFQVRAVNSAGTGDWSREASALPAAPIPVVVPPAVGKPNIPAVPTTAVGRSYVLWSWTPPSIINNDGTAPITGYQIQWRQSGNAWSGNVENVTGTCFFLGSRAGSTTFDARVRAINRLGTTNWSPVASATTLSPTESLGEVRRYLSPGTYSLAWSAFPGRTRAYVVAVGGSGGSGGQGGQGGTGYYNLAGRRYVTGGTGGAGGGGGRGGSSRVASASTTVTGAGGAGAAGGAGGAGSVARSQIGPWPPGAAGSFGDSPPALGSRAESVIAGLSSSSSLTIVVGFGGGAGDGGVGGDGSPDGAPGSPGGNGSPGYVEIVPLR